VYPYFMNIVYLHVYPYIYLFIYSCIPIVYPYSSRSRAMRDPARASAHALGRRSVSTLPRVPARSRSRQQVRGDHGKWRGPWRISLIRGQRLDHESGEKRAPLGLLGRLLRLALGLALLRRLGPDALALGHLGRVPLLGLFDLLHRVGGMRRGRCMSGGAGAGTPRSSGAWPSTAPLAAG